MFILMKILKIGMTHEKAMLFKLPVSLKFPNQKIYAIAAHLVFRGMCGLTFPQMWNQVFLTELWLKRNANCFDSVWWIDPTAMNASMMR